jgi:hypothetical protein
LAEKIIENAFKFQKITCTDYFISKFSLLTKNDNFCREICDKSSLSPDDVIATIKKCYLNEETLLNYNYFFFIPRGNYVSFLLAINHKGIWLTEHKSAPEIEQIFLRNEEYFMRAIMRFFKYTMKFNTFLVHIWLITLSKPKNRDSERSIGTPGSFIRKKSSPKTSKRNPMLNRHSNALNAFLEKEKAANGKSKYFSKCDIEFLKDMCSVQNPQMVLFMDKFIENYRQKSGHIKLKESLLRWMASLEIFDPKDFCTNPKKDIHPENTMNTIADSSFGTFGFGTSTKAMPLPECKNSPATPPKKPSPIKKECTNSPATLPKKPSPIKKSCSIKNSKPKKESPTPKKEIFTEKKTPRPDIAKPVANRPSGISI